MKSDWGRTTRDLGILRTDRLTSWGSSNAGSQSLNAERNPVEPGLRVLGLLALDQCIGRLRDFFAVRWTSGSGRRQGMFRKGQESRA